MTKKDKTKSISFTDTLGVSKEYAPKSAVHFIPDWYKGMETYFPKERTPDSLPTIKKCIPVLDAITAGYIIVSPCDVYVSFKDGEPDFRSSLSNIIGFPKIVSFHDRKQGYAHPLANEHKFPKWTNPWGIKTPSGYSCLFKPPAHNPNPWFQILEGIVDTDTYNATVNFPFVLKNTTEDFIIPAGTPIAQVIPFKRDGWTSQILNGDEVQRKTMARLESRFFDRYKHMFWNRKTYS